VTEIRHRVEPRDIPPVKAARRLHLTLEQFRASLPALIRRGFPHPDPTTGNYFLPDIDAWMENRNKDTRSEASAEDLMLDRIRRLS